MLNDSQIIAQAVGGRGGNITIDAAAFIASPDSIVSASSQLGISGSVNIAGQQFELDKSLAVLPSELRDATRLVHDKCAASTRSALVDTGRGGLPQEPDSAVPALYLAGRDVGLPPAPSRPAAAADQLNVGPLFLTSTRSTAGCQ